VFKTKYCAFGNGAEDVSQFSRTEDTVSNFARPSTREASNWAIFWLVEEGCVLALQQQAYQPIPGDREVSRLGSAIELRYVAIMYVSYRVAHNLMPLSFYLFFMFGKHNTHEISSA